MFDDVYKNFKKSSFKLESYEFDYQINLTRFEKNYIRSFLKTDNYKIIYKKHIKGSNYVFVILNDIYSDDINDYYKLIKLPVVRKYFLDVPLYEFCHIYVFKDSSGSIYTKYNKTLSLDKNNHFRPIKVGYINSKGDILIDLYDDFVFNGRFKKELIGVSYN